MKFRELSDGEWEFIEPLLPSKARISRPGANDRKAINGILSCSSWALEDEHASQVWLFIRLPRGGLSVGAWKASGPRVRPYRLNVEAHGLMKRSVERFFARLTGGFGKLALKWERLASNFLGLLQLACIMIYWRVLK